MRRNLLLVAAGLIGCISVMGQWNSDPAKNLQVWPDDMSYYYNEMAMTSDGKIWLAANYPQIGGVATGLQLIDADGNLLFEKPLVVSDFESRSWTSYGQVLFVDRDGNAIVSVYDFRYGGTEAQLENHTVYKISPEGEFLWGEEGITLEGENVYELVASMSICQLTDGSYVFAWMHNRGSDYSMFTIEMQRISADGEMLWNADDVRLYDEKTSYSYPYLVDGGNNQVILLYAKGSSQDLYARKIDFDGTPVWSEDTRVYNGGWGSIPIWSIITVSPAGDGGLLVSWNDDRYYTNIESAYMAYVKPNGEIGFTTENGQKLGYSGWRALNVKSVYDKSSDSFYAIWNECSSSQSWYRVVAQRITKDGELLWGENGLELKPMEQTSYGCLSVQGGADDEVAFFYMRNYAGTFGDVESFITVVNVNDTTIRRESEFTKGDRVSEKSGLASTPMYDGKYWVVKWTDDGAVDEEEKVSRLYMQRINNDLSLGANDDGAVEGVKTETQSFEALATLVENEAMFVTNMPNATQATLTVYNVNGALVATPFNGELAAGRQYIEWNADVPSGVYVATLTTPGNVETVKLIKR